MFGLFRSRPHTDPALGKLDRRGGSWRGVRSLAGVDVPFTLTGSREAPDRRALEIARDLPAQWEARRVEVGQALHEHYSVLVDAGVDAIPTIGQPTAVWHHVVPVFISIDGGEDPGFDAEIGLRVAWDDEHTLGARFLRGEFVELNGSVLEP